MKRWAGWLLTLALLLAGCSAADPAVPDAPEQSQSQEPAPPEETAEPDAPEESDAPALAPTGEATAGGFVVQTDYDNYTPHDWDEPVYTRLHEEPIEDLVPGEYGMLYPFEGSLLYYDWDTGSAPYAMYGLFDETGRIVADPTYTSVEQLTYYDNTGEFVRLPMWQLGRTEYAETVTYEDEYGSYEYIDGSRLYAVASFDGSFVSACRYRGVNAMDGAVLLTTDQEANDFELYSLDGTLLLTDEDLPFAGRMEPYACLSMTAGDGLFVVSLPEGWYYMDETGALVLGPYAAAERFRNDRAIVSADGTHYGLIDRAGNWIIGPGAAQLREAENGQFILNDRPSQTVRVVDRDSREVFHATADMIEANGVCYTCRMYDGGSTVYDVDGTVLLTDEEGTWSNVWGTSLFCDYAQYVQEQHGLRVLDVLTGKQAEFETGTLNPLYLDVMTGDRSGLPYYQIDCYDEADMSRTRLLLINQSLEVVRDLGQRYAAALRDMVTGEEYLVVTDYDSAELYNASLELLGTFPYDSLQVHGGKILYRDDFSFNCVDFDGTVLFRYPLLTSQGD